MNKIKLENKMKDQAYTSISKNDNPNSGTGIDYDKVS